MLTGPGPLDRDAILRRIPHQGTMCLLDAVLAWDADGIRCSAGSHRQPGHPLRAQGRLGAACGVEYAAQAMAMHGALVAESRTDGTAQAPRVGYLAAMRGVKLHVDRLDTVTGALCVDARRITGDGNTVLYSFSVHADGQPLLSGRATVVLDAAALGGTSP